MNFQPDELANRSKAEGEAVLAFFKEVPTELWDRDVYHAEGVWTVREVLAHFIAAEQGFQALIQNVAEGGSGVEEGFNIDDYNQRTVNELRGLEDNMLLAQFAMVRERTVALIRTLQASDLDRPGRHPFLGETTLGEMVRVIYHHNSLHIRDVRRALKSPGPGSQLERGLT